MWGRDVSTKNNGPVLPTELADRIDGMYEAIRRTKRSPVIDDDVIELLRGQVSTFSSLVMDTFQGMGYKGAIYQPSTLSGVELYVYMGNSIVVDVWDSRTATYRVRLDDVEATAPPLTQYRGQGQYVPGIRQVVECLQDIAATISAYRQCKDCYWSGKAGHYCGLGVVPEGICSHRYSMAIAPEDVYRYSNEVMTT